ncbi:hypothetical protein KM043_009786 [Ampulex compressa]|nr:hypothetical protein KM043_009786 [Ampulex compressa]
MSQKVPHTILSRLPSYPASSSSSFSSVYPEDPTEKPRNWASIQNGYRPHRWARNKNYENLRAVSGMKSTSEMSQAYTVIHYTNLSANKKMTADPEGQMSFEDSRAHSWLLWQHTLLERNNDDLLD